MGKRESTENSSLRKTKILHLQDILLSETDDEHGLTMPQIIDRLCECGIDAERKAIYDDLEALEAYGLDIIRGRGAGAEYAIGNRQFELPELLLLIDAVQSSRFLTKKKSEALIVKLQRLTSAHHKTLLDKSMHVEGRIKMQNESVYYNIDTIQEAIRNKRKISFRYIGYGFDKQEVFRRHGKQYTENPVELVYKDEFYYLITYNDKHGDFVRYRVDRMHGISETDVPISCQDAIRGFDVQEFVSRAFGMFGGDAVSAVLVVDQALIGPIIDRFGKDVTFYRVDETSARVHVHILKSGVFFGWLAQFGTGVVIEGPAHLAAEYKEYLQQIVEMY
ncbi:MAG: WYL domain-containing protein [Coriobacteriia bacterium]|nr:WYL domain-containing protein [Coriobacteriia bacterium]